MNDPMPLLDHERPTAPSLFGRVEVLSGTGLVLRRGNLLLVVPSVEGSQQEVLAELVGRCTRHRDRGGEDALRLLGELVSGTDAGGAPAFACLTAGSGQVHVMAYGAVQVAVDDQDPRSFTGARTQAWVQRSLPATFGSLSVRGPDTTDDPAARPGPGVMLLDLVEGRVPGAGVTLHRPAGQTSSGVGWTATGTTAPPGGRAATVLRATPTAHVVSLAPRPPDPTRARSPLPLGTAFPGGSLPFDGTTTPSTQGGRTPVLISGTICRCGGFTNPDLEECQSCGAPLDRDRPRVTRPRPPLGILITDDGRVFTVTDDVVLGREPEQAPEVRSGRARPVVVRDREQSTSRVHAEIRLSGWRVTVADRGSANGTFVSRSGSAGPWVLVPSEPGVPLAPGDRLRLGRREVLFDRNQPS